MDKKAWKKRYKDNLEEFEELQKRSIRNANRFAGRLEKANTDTLLDILMEVTDYFNAYFKHEENMLRVFDYPEYKAHREAHRSFINNMISFRRGHDESRKLAKAVARYLRSWVTHHLKGSDKSYEAFIRVQLFAKTKRR